LNDRVRQAGEQSGALAVAIESIAAHARIDWAKASKHLEKRLESRFFVAAAKAPC
jgi:hypothetical protein